MRETHSAPMGNRSEKYTVTRGSLPFHGAYWPIHGQEPFTGLFTARNTWRDKVGVVKERNANGEIEVWKENLMRRRNEAQAVSKLSLKVTRGHSYPIQLLMRQFRWGYCIGHHSRIYTVHPPRWNAPAFAACLPLATLRTLATTTTATDLMAYFNPGFDEEGQLGTQVISL